MKFQFKELTVSTEKQKELIDVTSIVEAAVAQSGVRNGLCLVQSLHSTTAI
ncbi:YjbQ family protein, partial [Candidatus Bathyarchaeota archaeon]|nr:YjbQ family protein [Candidatus Bathyarchaeota archaeon]